MKTLQQEGEQMLRIARISIDKAFEHLQRHGVSDLVTNVIQDLIKPPK